MPCQGHVYEHRMNIPKPYQILMLRTRVCAAIMVKGEVRPWTRYGCAWRLSRRGRRCAPGRTPVGCVIVRGEELVCAARQPPGGIAKPARPRGDTRHRRGGARAGPVAAERLRALRHARAVPDVPGAISQARLGRLVFGAFDRERGCAAASTASPRTRPSLVRARGRRRAGKGVRGAAGRVFCARAHVKVYRNRFSKRDLYRIIINIEILAGLGIWRETTWRLSTRSRQRQRRT